MQFPFLSHKNKNKLIDSKFQLDDKVFGLFSVKGKEYLWNYRLYSPVSSLQQCAENEGIICFKVGIERFAFKLKYVSM